MNEEHSKKNIYSSKGKTHKNIIDIFFANDVFLKYFHLVHLAH